MSRPQPYRPPSTPNLSLDVVPDGASRVRLVVGGEVDLATVGQLDDALMALVRQARAPLIEVDLRGVGFLDSSGIRTLLRAHTRAAQQGIRLIVTGPGPGVRRVLEITGVLGTLTGAAGSPGD